MARTNALDVPLLAGTLQTNELVIRDAVDRLIASPYRTVAMLGLSFKMNTDDLRESPNVELAERLIGKGFDVRIYDPIINPDRLMGSNLRYIESRLPHLRRLLSGRRARPCTAAVRPSSPRPTRARSTTCVGSLLPGSSTCTAGSAMTSKAARLRGNRVGGVTGSASGGCPATDPDHRPEPARSLSTVGSGWSAGP